MEKYIQLFSDVEEMVALILNILVLLIAGFRFKRMDSPGRVAAYIIALPFIMNNLIYVFPSIIILHIAYFGNCLLIAWFFNVSTEVFKRIRIWIFVLAAGIIFWFVNMVFFQPMNFCFPNDLSYFYYESFVSICFVVLSNFALFFLLRDLPYKQAIKKPLFYILVMNIFQFGVNYVYDISVPLVKTKSLYLSVSFFLDWVPADISLILMGIIFMMYPKKVKAIE